MTMVTDRISVLLLVAGIIQVGSAQFRSTVQNISILEFESAELDCGLPVETGAPAPIMWMFVGTGSEKATDVEVISLDGSVFIKTHVYQTTVRNEDGAKWSKLVVSGAGQEQDGQYVCKAKTIRGESVSQVHQLTVNIEPTIEMIPDSQIQVFNLGDIVSIRCAAEGKPQPTVTWGRVTPHSRFPASAAIEGDTLVVSAVGAYDAGRYECTASNGAGQPDTRSVDIQVHYPPNVTVEEEAIHTGPGDDLSIRCTFLAYPEVEVTWYHNDVPLTGDAEDRNLAFGEQRDEFEDTFTLRINGVTDADLGAYECFGKNELGQATGLIQLSAHPHSLVIESSKTSRYSDQYTLQWQVVSFPQISQYDLIVKELNDTIAIDFANHTLPAGEDDDEGSKPARSAKHVLAGLAPNTTYAVQLRAVNPFGTTAWNTFLFTTADEGNSAPPPTTAPPSTLPPPTKHTDDEMAVTKGPDTDATLMSSMEGSDVSSASHMVVSVLLLLIAPFLALL